jgi:acetyl-CoA synthetase
MQYLMSLANESPVIEYCGGTEIGGAYITETLLKPIAPGAFNSKALGIDFVLLDENGNVSDTGEVALIPPSIGLSSKLLNKDHHQVYYAGMSTYQGKILRRHGDEIKQ